MIVPFRDGERRRFCLDCGIPVVIWKRQRYSAERITVHDSTLERVMRHSAHLGVDPTHPARLRNTEPPADV